MWLLTGNSFDHVALHDEESTDDIKARFTAHDIDLERESNPFGATDTAPVIYVRDPSGYLLEIKETGEIWSEILAKLCAFNRW
ncbi:VOC family protein [Halocatena marina]|uniref:VOC family protein n=1 Tax=Halocatena marina TaxID=2934937 RepID=A0ABD5YZN8_9EURY|nr:hypothetical protein [Halocatena marina]